MTGCVQTPAYKVRAHVLGGVHSMLSMLLLQPLPVVLAVRVVTHSLCVSFLGTVALNASRSLLMMSQCCSVLVKAVAGELNTRSPPTSQLHADPAP
jgi:hypothetical protein